MKQNVMILHPFVDPAAAASSRGPSHSKFVDS